jgi:hypothetical protein
MLAVIAGFDVCGDVQVQPPARTPGCPTCDMQAKPCGEIPTAFTNIKGGYALGISTHYTETTLTNINTVRKFPRISDGIEMNLSLGLSQGTEAMFAAGPRG